jgi:hypothetical protein
MSGDEAPAVRPIFGDLSPGCGYGITKWNVLSVNGLFWRDTETTVPACDYTVRRKVGRTGECVGDLSIRVRL